MKTTKWLLVVLLTLGLVAGGFLIFKNEETPKTADSAIKTEKPEEIDSTPTIVDTGDEPAVTAGKYVDYSEEFLADETLGTKLLFFHAPWCPQCRELDASIEDGDIPNGVTIIKVDYDSNQKLRSRYGVTIQTTVVRISASGDLVEKYVAYDEPSLASLVENLL